MPALVEAAAPRLDLIALIHHPLALETGLEPAEAERLRRSEFRALASVRGVITTSRVTADGLTAYGVSRERTRVVEPGTDAAPLATGSGCERLNLLCVATLTPRKGHAILFEALSRVRDLSWRLACVGSAQRDPAHAQALRARIGALDLADRIQLVGQVDAAALANHYQAADACVLASHHEGYGMVLAEALAQGLPILSTTAGAIVHTVPETAGLLVPPGDVEAMAAALRRFLTDRQLRERLRAGALRARASLPSWNAACDAFADAVAHPARVSG
nr:glycosyltransferase family 4 protein [Thiocystis violacea]